MADGWELLAYVFLERHQVVAQILEVRLHDRCDRGGQQVSNILRQEHPRSSLKRGSGPCPEPPNNTKYAPCVNFMAHSNPGGSIEGRSWGTHDYLDPQKYPKFRPKPLTRVPTGKYATYLSGPGSACGWLPGKKTKHPPQNSLLQGHGSKSTRMPEIILIRLISHRCSM